MMHHRKCRALPLAAGRLALTGLTALLMSACNGGGGGDNDSSGDTDGGVDPDPDPAGQTCNEPGQGGWSVRCGIDAPNGSGGILGRYGSTNIVTESVFGETFWLETVYPGEAECCGGCPSLETVQNHCFTSCTEQLCNDLKEHHDAVATSSGFCGVPKFNMEACMLGQPYQQPRTRGLELLECEFKHFETVHANCGAPDWFITDRALDESGCFEWLSDGTPPPASCGMPVESGKGRAVVGGFTTDIARADAGTYASVSWELGGDKGTERSEDVEVDLAYARVDCGKEQCFSLSQFQASIPNSSVEGLKIENAQLYISRATDVAVGRSGDFSYAPGDLEAVLSADVNGMRVSLVGVTEDKVSGHASPSTGVVYLRDLEFDYTSDVFNASLTLSVEGAYTSTQPVADIAVVSAPASCSDPVAFVAATKDYDGDALSHKWEVATDGRVGSGELFEVELPAGEHRIVLRSSDGTPREGYATLDFRRRCRP